MGRPFSDDPDEMDERLDGLLETPSRIEFQLAVEIVSTGKNVGTGQTPERELGAVRAAANRPGLRWQARAPRRLERPLDQMGLILQDVVHVPVLLDDRDVC